MKKILLLFLMLLVVVGCTSNKNVIDEDKLYYVVELNDNTIVLGPEDYLPEKHDSYKNDLLEVQLASPITYCDTTINIMSGDVQKEDLIVLQGTIETITDAMEFGFPYVFVECNDDGEIDKIILYGELAFQ